MFICKVLAKHGKHGFGTEQWLFRASGWLRSFAAWLSGVMDLNNNERLAH